MPQSARDDDHPPKLGLIARDGEYHPPAGHQYSPPAATPTPPVVQPLATPTHATAMPPQAYWSIERWWLEKVLPDMQNEGISTARIGEYRTAVTRWTAWEKSAYSPGTVEHRTCTPVLYPLHAITPDTLSSYRRELTDRGITTASGADKNTAAIMALLRRAERGWIITRTPTIKPVTTPNTGLLFVFSADEMSALYRLTDSAAWPTRDCHRKTIDPAPWWRLFLVGGWNYGFRPGEWWQVKSSKKPTLLWSGVNLGTAADIEGRTVHNDHGWLSWTQSKTKRRVTLPMNMVVRRHVDAVLRALPGKPDPGERVFAFPRSSGTSKPYQTVYPSSGFYSAWWDLVQRAGFSPIRDGDGKAMTYRPSQFRKTARTLHQDLVGAAAAWITGHRPESVGVRNYYLAIGKVMESMESIEQPAAFLEPAADSL